MSGSSNNDITENTCSDNYRGLELWGSTNNNITNNNALNNRKGIAFHDSSTNTIYLNNFIENTGGNIFFDSTNIWNSAEEITYAYNGNTYTGYLGNYWSDYTGSDANGDGIGDTPYSIDSDKDDYPLMNRFENYEIGPPPTPPTIRTVPPLVPTVSQWGALAMVIALAGCIIWTLRRRVSSKA